MRDRLIELLEEENGISRYITADERRERIADHLIANGVVIIDPVKYPPVTNRGIIDSVMGMPLDEVADLIKAKQEGRIIVPPCKVGNAIFFCVSECYEPGKQKINILDGEVVSFSLQEEGIWAFCRYKCGLTYWHLIEDFGKTVFLTKAEAENSLAERRES